MIIYKLIMTIDKNYRYNPQETSYHISEKAARSWFDRKRKEGYIEKEICSPCEEGDGYPLSFRFEYSPIYNIVPIEVNEKE